MESKPGQALQHPVATESATASPDAGHGVRLEGVDFIDDHFSTCAPRWRERTSSRSETGSGAERARERIATEDSELEEEPFMLC